MNVHCVSSEQSCVVSEFELERISLHRLIPLLEIYFHATNQYTRNEQQSRELKALLNLLGNSLHYLKLFRGSLEAMENLRNALGELELKKAACPGGQQ